MNVYVYIDMDVDMNVYRCGCWWVMVIDIVCP